MTTLYLARAGAAVLFALPFAPLRAPADAPTSAELLAQMRAAYATCATYRDTGVAERRWIGTGDVAQSEEFPFVTAFERGTAFRFQWGERSATSERWRKVVWAAGDEVRNWPRGEPHAWECTSLPGALARDAAGAAPLVASLLEPERFAAADRAAGLPGAPLDDFVPSGEPAREAVDGRDGWRVALAPVRGGERRAVAWIDAKRSLLLRFETSEPFPDQRVVTTIRFEPELGVAIAPAELALAAPPAEERRRASGDAWFVALVVVPWLALVLVMARRWFAIGRRRDVQLVERRHGGAGSFVWTTASAIFPAQRVARSLADGGGVRVADVVLLVLFGALFAASVAFRRAYPCTFTLFGVGRRAGVDLFRATLDAAGRRHRLVGTSTLELEEGGARLQFGHTRAFTVGGSSGQRALLREVGAAMEAAAGPADPQALPRGYVALAAFSVLFAAAVAIGSAIVL